MHVCFILTGVGSSYMESTRIPPWYADVCWPKSTVTDTSNKGAWVRVERNINWKSGPWYLVSPGRSY
jgi:hypothetical protein